MGENFVQKKVPRYLKKFGQKIILFESNLLKNFN